MKPSFLSAAAVVAGILFTMLQPAAASAEPSSNFAQQPQISTLVTIAIPPYKR
ncbi:hypothetical protein [uncultured Oxalicibacterium sp.]|uniref:hypothetical protein n=1 Tax=uncultured Oxalicibacterium sp. TaxID=1168540 RepID=UPI0025E240AD|nr:hypothetical protein [uncultured Oxalicibacterium sp.]